MDREAGGVLAAKVRSAYRHLYQRDVRDDEWDAAMAFLNGAVGTSTGPGGIGRFEQMIQMMMISNEFLFVE